MKKNLAALFVCFIAISLIAVSCDKDEPEVYRSSVNGLWASSANDLESNFQTMLLMEIADGTARVATVYLGQGLSSVTNGEEYYASVSYDKASGKGEVKVAEDPLRDIEFGLSKDGDRMFARNGDQHYVLSHYSGSMKRMVSYLNDAFAPSLQTMDGFTGPSEYVDLSWETPVEPSLNSALGLSMTILGWIGKGLVTGTSSAIAKIIISALIEDDESKQLDAILAQISDVNMRLSELINLVHNTTYERYLNERTNSYLNPMRNLSSEYVMRVEEAWQTDSTKVGPIVKEWANRTVGGNPAYVEAKNFIDYLTGTVVEQKNLYQMYDMYVYNTHPWENMGYALREGLRAGDVAVLAQSLLLTKLYYIYGDFSDDTKARLSSELEESYKKYLAFFKTYDVERHDGQAICQIEGAHFAMSTELVERDFKSLKWMPSETPWEFDNNDSAWFLVNGDTKYTCPQTYRYCMSKAEADAINKYYKGSSYTNMLDVLLKDAGCSLPFSDRVRSGKKVMMQMQTEGSTEWQVAAENNYYVYMTTAMTASENFLYGKQTIGVAWLERHGFLWLETWFKQWDTYYSDQLWFRTTITSRF